MERTYTGPMLATARNLIRHGYSDEYNDAQMIAMFGTKHGTQACKDALDAAKAQPTAPVKGLTVSIYKDGGKSHSNGGISSIYDEALIIGENIPEIFSGENLPIITLERGAFAGTVRAKPVHFDGKAPWYMFGGCFIHTSDSRFTEAVRKIVGGEFYGAVALHDRTE